MFPRGSGSVFVNTEDAFRPETSSNCAVELSTFLSSPMSKWDEATLRCCEHLGSILSAIACHKSLALLQGVNILNSAVLELPEKSRFDLWSLTDHIGYS